MEKSSKVEDFKFDIQKFKIAGEVFFRQLCLELNSQQVPIQEFKADHLCFRVQDYKEYVYYKNALLQFAILLTETNVNGRPICTFKLESPFVIDDKTIELVELPAPKVGTDYKTGFEHAEFVITEPFQIFRERYSRLNFKEDNPKVINNELVYRSKVGIAKFHHLSLDRVIDIESAEITDVVFDFDGTIINSREQIYEINRIVFSKVLERDVSYKEAVLNYFPEYSKLLDAFDITCEIKKKSTMSLWSEVAKDFTSEIFSGVEELLWKLKRSGKYKLHLWTARDEVSSRHILLSHNMEHFFSSMSFASSTHSKPQEKSLNFDWRSLSKNSILVIGDSPSDIQGAKNIGAIAGAALWDSNSCINLLVSAGAELYFPDPNSFLNWLEKNYE